MSKLECKYQFFVSGLEDTTIALDDHEKDTLARLAIRTAKQKLQKFIKVRPRSTYPPTIEKILSIVNHNNVKDAQQLATLLPVNNIAFRYVTYHANEVKEALKRTLGFEFTDFDEVFVD